MKTRSHHVKLLICLILASVTLSAASTSQRRSKGESEFFSLTADVQGATGSSAASMKLQLDRYMADSDRAAVTEALKTGGSGAFLEALRKAPGLGKLTAGNQTFTVRWATQTPIKNGRTIVVVTDSPVFFLGGGELDAKPREGYDVGVLRFDFDDAGLGFGTMAPAARVKPGGLTGVQVDDYGRQPAKVRITKVDS
jgi:hypothetical protein